MIRERIRHWLGIDAEVTELRYRIERRLEALPKELASALEDSYLVLVGDRIIVSMAELVIPEGKKGIAVLGDNAYITSTRVIGPTVRTMVDP